MRVAVTGAAGHIGSKICAELLAGGNEVRALVRNDVIALEELLCPSLTLVRGDVLDVASLRELIGENCDAVVHTAAIVALSYKADERLREVNVTGTKNVLNIAKELSAKCVVYVSSVHAFRHKPHDVPLDETREFVDDKSAIFYDRTKRDAQLAALQAAAEGQRVVIICPTGVVGPPDHKPSKLGQGVLDVVNGKITAAVQGGFDFVDVRDVAKTIVSAITNGRSGETYIVGGSYYSIKEFCDYALEAKGSKKRLAELPVWSAMVGLPFMHFWSWMQKKPALYDKITIDILRDGNPKIVSDKAKKELGHNPRHLSESVRDAVSWFQKRKLC